MIIGFGDSFTQALKDTIAAAYAAHPEGPSFGDYLGVGGASLFYGVTGYMAPGLAGSMLNGTVAMSLQSAGTAAGMVGGAPVAAGLAASSAAGARALGLAGGAMGALLPVQKAAEPLVALPLGAGFGRDISGSVGAVNNSSTQSVNLFRLLVLAIPATVPELPAVQTAKALLTRLAGFAESIRIIHCISPPSQMGRTRTPNQGPVPDSDTQPSERQRGGPSRTQARTRATQVWGKPKPPVLLIHVLIRLPCKGWRKAKHE